MVFGFTAWTMGVDGGLLVAHQAVSGSVAVGWLLVSPCLSARCRSCQDIETRRWTASTTSTSFSETDQHRYAHIDGVTLASIDRSSSRTRRHCFAVFYRNHHDLHALRPSSSITHMVLSFGTLKKKMAIIKTRPQNAQNSLSSDTHTHTSSASARVTWQTLYYFYF
jgi:hypothetical protein